MNSMLLFEAIGETDEKYVKEAKDVNKRRKNIITFTLTAAACLLLFFFIPNIPNFFGMKAQEGDIFRNGYLIENVTIKELTENFEGKLLAENLIGDSKFEFYSKTEKFSADNSSWYSLLYSQYNTDSNIIMHCLFGEDTENWKIDMVFTEDATKTVNVNGVDVEIAKFDLSLNFPYTYYAIFQYDGAVYDIRVYSNEEDAVIKVLEKLIK